MKIIAALLALGAFLCSCQAQDDSENTELSPFTAPETESALEQDSFFLVPELGIKISKKELKQTWPEFAVAYLAAEFYLERGSWPNSETMLTEYIEIRESEAEAHAFLKIIEDIADLQFAKDGENLVISYLCVLEDSMTQKRIRLLPRDSSEEILEGMEIQTKAPNKQLRGTGK